MKIVKIIVVKEVNNGSMKITVEIPVPSLSEREEARSLHKTIEDATTDVFQPVVAMFACQLAGMLMSGPYLMKNREVLTRHMANASEEIISLLTGRKRY
jgi:hypothetical protein